MYPAVFAGPGVLVTFDRTLEFMSNGPPLAKFQMQKTVKHPKHKLRAKRRCVLWSSSYRCVARHFVC